MDLESHGKILNLGWTQESAFYRTSRVKGRNLEPGKGDGREEREWFKRGDKRMTMGEEAGDTGRSGALSL